MICFLRQEPMWNMLYLVRKCLIFTHLICPIEGTTQVDGLCLPDGIKHENRLPLIIQGREVPLGIWGYNWESAQFLIEIVRLLASEVLGIHATIIGSTGDVESGLYALAGCRQPNNFETEPECAPAFDPVWDHHVAVEVWEGELRLNKLKSRLRENPEVWPEELGSCGYSGRDGAFFKTELLVEAWNTGRLALDFYKSYDAAKPSARPFFDRYSDIDLAQLRACEDTRASLDTIQTTNLVRFTGDVDGVHMMADGSAGPARCWNGSWWFAPSCRNDPNTCFPFITGGNGWSMFSFMQKAVIFNMPLAIAVARTGTDYSDIPRNHRVVFYWWMPDSTFASMSVEKVLFPEHNAEEWEKGRKFSSSNYIWLGKYVHNGLQIASNKAHYLVRNLEISFNGITDLVQELIVSGDTIEQVACRWVQQHETTWKNWIREDRACQFGEGLSSADGTLLLNLTGATGCHFCPPGRFSEAFLALEIGRTFVCSLCQPGSYNSEMLQSECRACDAATYQSNVGATACAFCQNGEYNAERGRTQCEVCPDARTTRDIGATYISQCICSAGMFENDGTCTYCPLLHTSHVAGEDCEILADTWFIITAGPVFIFVALMGYFFVRRYYVKKMKVMRRNILNAAIRTTASFSYPMVLVSFQFLKSLPRLQSHEQIRQQFPGRLIFLESVDDAESLKSKGIIIIFISHQWTAWDHPDHTGEQFESMLKTIERISLEEGLTPESLLIWIDYMSVPQAHTPTQALAINSLCLYAFTCSVLVVVSPPICHQDLGTVCDTLSYRKRGWCSAEQLAFFCRHAGKNMWIADDAHPSQPLVKHDSSVLACGSITSMKDEAEDGTFLLDAIHVFQGEFTCCARNHVGMDCCDKEKLVTPILGLFGLAYARHFSRAGDAKDVIHGISGMEFENDEQALENSRDVLLSNSDDLFPKKHKVTRERRGRTWIEKRPLFGNLIKEMKVFIDENGLNGEDAIEGILRDMRTSFKKRDSRFATSKIEKLPCLSTDTNPVFSHVIPAKFSL